MSDIALKASIDFRDAEKQVNEFVNKTKKKMSEIMAAAAQRGGSLGGGVTGGGSPSRGGGRLNNIQNDIRMRWALERSYTSFWKKELDAKDRLSRVTNQAFERERKMRAQADRDNRAFDLRRERAAATLARANETAIERERKMRAQADRDNRAFDLRRERAAAALARTNETAIERERKMRAQADRDNLAFDLRRARAAAALSRANETAIERERKMRAQADRDNRSFDLRRERTAAQAIERERKMRAQADRDNLAFDLRKSRAAAALARTNETAIERERKMRAQADRDNLAFDLRKSRAAAALARTNETAIERERKMRAQADRDNLAFDLRRERAAAASSRNMGTADQSRARVIGGAENTALGVRNRIGRQLSDDPALQTRLINQLDGALRNYTGTVQTYGARSIEATRATVVWNRELQNIRGTIAEKGGLLRTLNTNTETLRSSIGSLGTGFGSLNRLMLNTQVVLSGLTAALGLREVLDAIQVFERFSNTLRTVSASTGEFQQNMAFLFGEADRIGFSVGEVGNAFARLSVAMSGAGFSTEETRRAFTGLSEASRNFGITSADTNGIIRALEQSMSKGKFMAEEVRLQMGDRLPIAMAALKAAMERVDGGIVDVNKRFEEGTIDVRRYAMAFVEEINRMSGGAEALQRTSTSLSAAFGRLSTEFLRFSQALGEGGLTNATITVTENLRNLMETARESGALNVLGDVLEKLANSMNLFVAAGVALGALFAGRMVQALISFAAAASPVVRVLSLLAGGAVLAFEMIDRVTSSGRAFNTFNSAMRDFNTSAENVRGTISQFNNVLSQNTQQLSSSSTAVERRIEALRRLGEGEAEATRIAAAEERRRIQIRAESMRADLARAEAAQATQNRQALGRTGRAFVDGFNNSRAIANSPRFNNIADDASAHVVARYNAGIQVVTDFTSGVLTAREAVRKLNETFADGTMPSEIDAIRRAINEASMSEQFTASEEAIRSARRELESIDRAIAEFAAKYSNAINIQINMDLVRRELADAPNTGQNGRNVQPLSGVDAQGNRTGVDGTTASEITRNPTPARAAQAVRTALTEHNLDRTIDGGNRFGFDARAVSDRELITQLRGNPLFRNLLPGASAALGRVNINEGGGGNAARLGNAVGELVQDINRQADAAGVAEGAAKAYADALNRLKDAAANAQGGIDINAASTEVLAAVTRRLNSEYEAFNRYAAQAMASNNEVADAYIRSSEAGQQAELRIRAMTEARKTAIEFEADGVTRTALYNQRVNELITTLGQAEQAERGLAAAREISRNNDEIEVLEAESRLIASNADAREREVAAIRARQQARGSGREDAAGLSAARVVELRQRNELMSNSWNEMGRVAEQAFERVGSAITEAFAKGEIRAVKFSNIYRAIVSEIIQATLRMAVLNPILNSALGGSRPTMAGLFQAQASGAASSGSGSSGIVGGAASIAGMGTSINNWWNGTSSTSAAPASGASGGFAGLAGIGASISNWWNGTPATAAAASTYMGPGALADGAGFQAAGAGAAPAAASGAAGGAGSMLGGMALGFGLGSMAGGLVAGNSRPRQQNAQIGAAIGAVALGPIGGLAGGLIGGAIGPGNPRSFGHVGVESRDGRLAITGSGGKNTDVEALLSSARREIESLNDQLDQRGWSLGGSTYLGNGVADIEQFDTLGESTALRLRTGDARVDGAIARADGASLERQFSVAERAQSFADQLDQMTNAIKDATNPLGGITREFDELWEQADRLGFGWDQVTEAANNAVAEFNRNRYRANEDAAMGFEGRAAGTDRAKQLAAQQRSLQIEQQREREDLERELMALGLDAQWVANLRPELERAQAVETAAMVKAWEALWRSQREAVEGLSIRADRARASVSGNAMDAQGADLRAFDLQASGEIIDTRQALLDLGLAADAVEAEILKLIATHGLERQAIAETYQARRNAIATSLDDRLFAATTDTQGLSGALAAFERAASREREQAAREGLTNLVQLEAVHAAERADLIEEFARQSADRIRALGGSIRSFLDGLSTDASITSPQDRLAAAQEQFGRDLTLARGGDEEALGRITGTADTLLTAGKDMYASSPQFQAILSMVRSSLENLPAVKNYDALILAELQSLRDGIAVGVDLEVFRVITEALNALSPVDRERLIQAATVLRNITQTVQTPNGDSLITEANITRQIQLGFDYAVANQFSYLHNLADIRMFLSHIRDMARGGAGGLRVTTYQASGAANDDYARGSSSQINPLFNPLPARIGGVVRNYGGLQSGGWVGNGAWNRDSVIAGYAGGGSIMLAGGEHVTNAVQAARYEPILNSINTGDYNPNFGGGEMTAQLSALASQVAMLNTQVSNLREEAARTAEAAERTADAAEDTAKTNKTMARNESVAARRVA
jgi:tape measure domain-containing protein